MTKTYLTINEEKFEADTPDELVGLLHDSSYAQTVSDTEFMKQMAGRIKFQMGQEIRCDTAENFVADLINVGYLKETKDEPSDGKE